MVVRISEHDGAKGEEGGIGAWLRLGEACGVPREELLDDRHLVPGVRFAVDAYVHFARTSAWPVAIASSLTELFAPDLMARRLEAFRTHYQWVPDWGFDYFTRRLTQARKDSASALDLTLRYCSTAELQQGAVAALSFKCDILWAVLDAIDLKYGKLGPMISPDLRERPQLAPHVRLRSDPLSGDPVLLFPEGLVVLNATAFEIVRHCNGQSTIANILKLLLSEFEIEEDALRTDVLLQLEKLRERNLLSYLE